MQIRLDSEDIAFFVYPRANQQLRHAEPVIRKCALPHVKSRVHILYLDELLDSIERLVLNKRARSHYSQFRAKYILEEPISARV